MSETAPSSEGQPQPAASVERRAFVRYGSDLEASCRPAVAAREPGWFAKVRDISAGGVGLLFRHRFARGTPLLVELKHIDGTVLAVLPVRVVHATPVRTGADLWWLTGCAFPQELTEVELRPLLS